jgi:hypothetical protein
MMEIKATIRFNEQFKKTRVCVLDCTRHSRPRTAAAAAAAVTVTAAASVTATATATATVIPAATGTTRITTNALSNDAVKLFCNVGD